MIGHKGVHDTYSDGIRGNKQSLALLAFIIADRLLLGVL